MLLNQTLKSYGIDPAACYRTNVIMCSCTPKPAHLDACWDRVRDEIIAHKPKLVLTLGRFAFQGICRTKTTLAATEGTLWWQPELNCWVVPTWHPAAVLRGGADDKFFPRIADSIWRIGRYLSGKDPIPSPNKERDKIPWTFFRTPEGAEKALQYYLRQANGAQELGYAIELGCDTESHSPGFGVAPDWLYLPEQTVTNLKKKGKGRPHAYSDTWIMLQLYDGQRAAVFDMTATRNARTDFLLKKLLRHPGVIWVGHNFAQYDTQVFRANGLPAPRDEAIRDTMVWGLGLSERRSAVGLEPLSRTWLNTSAYKRGLKASGYRHQKGPQNEEQWHNLAVYGMDDAVNTWKLNRKLPPLVQDQGTTKLCNEILLPLALTCGKLASRGFPIDTKQIDKLEELWGGRTNQIVAELNEFAHNAGWPKDPHLAKPEPEKGWGKRRVFTSESTFNPRSHDQLAHLAFDVLGLQATSGSTNRKFCVPNSTEILTRTGWKRHDEVKVGDETIGYNPNSCRNEWTKITAVNRFPDSEVWHIGTDSWSAEVTPNHRWLTQRRTRGAHPTDPELIETNELLSLRSGRLILSVPAEFRSGLPKLTDDEAEILGWAMGDGRIEIQRPESGRYTVRIFQSKPEQVEHLRKLLFEVPHTESVLLSKHKRKDGSDRFPSYTFYLRASFANSLLDHARYRELNAEEIVLRMSQSQRERWLIGIGEAEGHVGIYANGKFHGVSISQNDGHVQEAIKLAAYLSGYRPTARKRNGKNLSIGLCRPLIHPPNLRRKRMSRQPVWCPTTELGTWTARGGDDKNLPFLTGNSGTAKNLRGRDRSCDADFLAANEDPVFCGMMTKLRIYDKLVRTYVRGLAREIDRDGLIHPDANIAATDTGRLVWKPLLQVLLASALRGALSTRGRGLCQGN